MAYNPYATISTKHIDKLLDQKTKMAAQLEKEIAMLKERKAEIERFKASGGTRDTEFSVSIGERLGELLHVRGLRTTAKHDGLYVHPE
jgi:hypothetical protein